MSLECEQPKAAVDEALLRFIWPVAISFNEAILIAALGLAVSVASVLLHSGGGYDYGHSRYCALTRVI